MHPLAVVSDLRERYARYVDSFQFYKNPAIREWVHKRREDGRLLYREPFLTLAKPFAGGASLESLVEEDVVESGVLSVFSRKPGDPDSGPVSPFLHQEQAIRQVMAGHNTAVTTGTGSGKSFTFYIPIVSTALTLAKDRDPSAFRSPIAVIIYPMNALANSQYEDISARLQKSGLTVCNYTGDLKTTIEGALKDFKQLTGRDTPYDSEVIDRETLHAKGCDVLLTNFKMLEYALVRRGDATLFETLGKGGRLQFLVLDEMHTYSGHQGADMAMLVRRFKSRTGTAGKLRCIGTSATVDSGNPEEAKAIIAGFATKLFGEPFASDSVIGESYGQPETADPSTGGLYLSPNPVPASVVQAAEDADSDDDVAQTLGAEMLGGAVDAESVRNALPVAWLERTLWSGVVSMARLVDRYIKEVRHSATRDQAAAEIASALMLGTAVKTTGPKGDPVGLLTPKVHSFFSQGLPVTRCLVSEDPPHLFEQGDATCGDCLQAGMDDVPAFPVVFCQSCGQDFYVAEDQTSHINPRDFLAAADGGQAVYLMTDSWDQDSVPVDPKDVYKNGTPKKGRAGAVPISNQVCGQCGSIGPNCQHAKVRDIVMVAAPFLLCPACGVRYDGNHSEYNKFFQVGTVGRATATDVLVDGMLNGQDAGQGASKAQVMAFTDNQQDSSFQAAHLRSMSRRFHVRRALIAALQAKASTEQATALDTGELADAAFQEMVATKTVPAYAAATEAKAGFGSGDVSAKGKNRYLRYLKTGVLLESSGGPRKNQPNLEDTGLLVVDYADFERGNVAPTIFQDESLGKMIRAYAETDPELTEDLLRIILDVMRREHAVVSPNENGPAAAFMDPDRFTSEVLDQIAPTVYFHAGLEIPRRRSRYDERRESKGRTQYRRLAGAVQPDGTDSPQTTKLTRWLKKEAGLPDDPSGTVAAKKLIREAAQALRSYGYLVEDSGGLAVNEERLHYWYAEEPQGFRCMRCAARWMLSRERSCPRCVKSAIKPDRSGRDDFFRDSYVAPLDERTRVESEEHTGSLDGDKRKEIETRFRDQSDPLNVLVCTPTMELGVDIGTLSAVYMRNVPPSPANYAQRQGRAGRSAQPSMVVTFCSAQGRAASHDQYFFKRPERIISGKITAPRFLLDNQALLEAHTDAIVLGSFAGVHSDLPRELDTWTMLEAGVGGLSPAFRATLDTYIAENRDQLIQTASETFADVLEEGEAVSSADLASTIDSFSTRLDTAMAALVDYAEELKLERAELNARGDKGQLDRSEQRRWEAIGRIRGKIYNGEEDFQPLAWLAARGFLPSYAFPRRAMMLRFSDKDRARVRSRSIALREFAPGNSIYHLGKRYQVTRASSGRNAEEITAKIFLCQCGYYLDGDSVDTTSKCPNCDRAVETQKIFRNAMPVMDQYAIQRDTVGADLEERLRQGYRVDAAYRLPTVGARSGKLVTSAGVNMGLKVGRLGHVMQANTGLLRSPDHFSLCARCRLWNPDAEHYGANSACLPASENLIQDIVLFNDGRHDMMVLSVTAPDGVDPDTFAYTLMYALRAAMGTHFGIDDGELGGEIYPEVAAPQDRRVLIYEMDEGGIGVLERMTDSDIWRAVAARALDILHVSVDEGVERDDACGASCYECLRSFYNQWHHDKLDRNLVIDFFSGLLQGCSVDVAPRPDSWDEVVTSFDSLTEQAMVAALRAAGIPAPTKAHQGLPETEPVASADLYYVGEGLHLAVFLDGGVHDGEVQQKIDGKRRDRLKDLGYSVLVVHHSDMESGIEALKARLH